MSKHCMNKHFWNSERKITTFLFKRGLSRASGPCALNLFFCFKQIFLSEVCWSSVFVHPSSSPPPPYQSGPNQTQPSLKINYLFKAKGRLWSGIFKMFSVFSKFTRRFMKINFNKVKNYFCMFQCITYCP